MEPFRGMNTSPRKIILTWNYLSSLSLGVGWGLLLNEGIFAPQNLLSDYCLHFLSDSAVTVYFVMNNKSLVGLCRRPG